MEDFDLGFMDEVRTAASTETRTADIVRVRILKEDYERLRSHLCRGDGLEYAAFLTAGTQTYTTDESDVFEFLITDVHPISPEDYQVHSGKRVSLPGMTIRDTAATAADTHLYADDHAVLMAHSHTDDAFEGYSHSDNSTEPGIFSPLSIDGEGPHGSLLVTPTQEAGRVWADDSQLINDEEVGAADPIDELVIVGEDALRKRRTTNSRLPDRGEEDDVTDQARARQALVTGPDGNRRLRESHVAIVGVGGIGSLIAQDLAHEGVGELTLVDPDVLEESNRSRVMGSSPGNAGPESATPDGDGVTPASWAEAVPGAGRPKVEVVADMVSDIDPSIRVHGVHAPIEDRTAMRAAAQADVLVAATDHTASRELVSELGQRYLRPVFDAGSGINAEDGVVGGIETTFALTGPPWACRDCQGLVDREAVRVDGRDPDDLEYGLDLLDDEQPSVLAVNRYPAAQTGFALYAYLTGIFQDQHQVSWDTGSTQLTIADRRPIPDEDPDTRCPRCTGGVEKLRGTGDRALFGAITEMDPVHPEGVETGAVAELSDEYLREAVNEMRRDLSR